MWFKRWQLVRHMDDYHNVAQGSINWRWFNCCKAALGYTYGWLQGGTTLYVFKGRIDWHNRPLDEHMNGFHCHKVVHFDAVLIATKWHYAVHLEDVLIANTLYIRAMFWFPQDCSRWYIWTMFLFPQIKLGIIDR